MRSYEDIRDEMLNLRDAVRNSNDELNKTRQKLKDTATELEWWRKTFGPEKFA